MAQLRRWRRRAAVAAGRLGRGVRTLLRLHPGLLAASVVLAVIQWSCRYSILPIVLGILGAGVDPLPLVYLQGLLLLGGTLVALPGGGGTVELTAGAALALFVPGGLVGAAVLIWRFFTFHLYLLGGAAALAACSATAPAPAPQRPARRYWT